MAPHTPRAYTYHADIYCTDCGAALPVVDPEGNEKHPIYSWELADMGQTWEGETLPPNCGDCGKVID